MICENMLMAEGFVTAAALSKKFVTLYFLCRDLLSKQKHYDWGLRAIKSVLVVAGNMKRAEKVLGEDAVLMRALRDFNLPKIVADDLPIFHGLLGDLFPGINPERARDMDFEAVIKDVTIAAGLHPDENFLRKVVELEELQRIRHCVFTMGPPGAGKSSTWKMLQRANDKIGKKTTLVDLNPKVINSDELYGYVQMSTREWKDGILSNKMRALSELPDENPKWLIFDGDLDATWIESMNSVMDDNKLLTLASNERI
jgi:dynein heavy chain